MLALTPSLTSPRLACCVAVLFVGGAESAWAADSSSDSPQVKQLLTERLAILTTIYESRAEAHEQGVVSFDKVQDAQLALFEAKLELCDTKEERHKVYEEIVEVARKSMHVVEELYKAAQTPQSELLAAKLRLLDAQIRLEGAKASK